MIILRKLISRICILTALLAAAGTANAADQSIAEFEAVQQAAWNAHDAQAYAATFAPDAEIITYLGDHWTGQAEAGRNSGNSFRLDYAHARRRIMDLRVHALTAELVSITMTWAIDGVQTADAGTQGQQSGLETQVVQRHGDSWLVLSQQDTATPQPQPQPAAAWSPDRARPAATTSPASVPPVRRCVVARGNGECLIYGKAKPPPAP